MAFLNTLFNFVQSPSAAINKIMHEPRFGFAVLGYIVGALSILMMCSLEGGGSVGRFWLVSGFLLILFFNVCVGFFFASSAHLFLELTTGKGSAAGLFVLLGLSEFTKTLLVAFALSASALPALAAARTVVVILVLLLQLFFVLFMMQKAYGLSKIRTFFALFVSFVPSLISLLVVGFAVLGFIFWLIFK